MVNLSGKKVLVMAGRFHLYEGYNAWEVTYGIRTLHGLGIKNLLISNAAGAINLSYKKERFNVDRRSYKSARKFPFSI